MPSEPQARADVEIAHLRVLVVDDEPDVRLALCSHLERRGHTAQGASTMEEALKAIEGSAIDVLVTDVLLPDGDGIDVLNHVVGRKPPVRAVVVTGGGRYFGPDYFRRIGEALGATVLQKPFDRETFLAAVEGTPLPGVVGPG